MYIFIFLISFSASIIGAICGIGGGIIIKPVMDAFGVLDVSTINFLSGCTVLSMTSYTVLKNLISKQSDIRLKTGTPLAIGAAIGGLIGKELFSYVSMLFDNPNKAGAVQASILFLMTLLTLIYTMNKDKIHTYNASNILSCIGIGIMLGCMSSFLGIGGGPINLVVLYFFFSMSTKEAAQNSLYIILFSQTASLIRSLCIMDISHIHMTLLVGMILCGILGGICGRSINQKIENEKVDSLFKGLMIIILGINIFNVYQFVFI